MRELRLNRKTVTVEAEDGTPLLWVIRDELKLTGTKFGCGVAACGACTVHLDGLCCAKRVRDSCRESRVVAGQHEQTDTSDLQDHELGCLQ